MDKFTNFDRIMSIYNFKELDSKVYLEIKCGKEKELINGLWIDNNS
jgi:hypothetical protein